MWTIISEFCENNQYFFPALEAIAVVVSAVFVIWEYSRKKRDARTIAATIVIEQIQDIEGIISDVKKTAPIEDDIILSMRQIIKENLWDNNKHLLMKKLTSREIATIDGFYQLAERLEAERNHIQSAFISCGTNKSMAQILSVAQIYQTRAKQPMSDEEKNKTWQEIFNFTNVFDPDINYFILSQWRINFGKELRKYEPLTDGCAFSKLYKLSYRKNK